MFKPKLKRIQMPWTRLVGMQSLPEPVLERLSESRIALKKYPFFEILNPMVGFVVMLSFSCHLVHFNEVDEFDLRRLSMVWVLSPARRCEV